MAELDEKIVEELNRRFSEPLRDHYKRRIIFWHDVNREFEDAIADLQLDDAEVLAVDGSNYFKIKRQISFDFKDKNLLIYNPMSFDNNNIEDDWLLDVKKYSEQFFADVTAIWISEMGLENTSHIREAIMSYQKFFKRKDNRNKIACLDNKPTKGTELKSIALSIICGSRKSDYNSILIEVLKDAVESRSKDRIGKLQKLNALDDFKNLILYGKYGMNVDDVTPIDIALKIFLTAATEYIDYEKFSGLENYINEQYAHVCHDLLSDWLHSDPNSLREVAEKVELEKNLKVRYLEIDLYELADNDFFPGVDEVLLIRLIQEIENNSIAADAIDDLISRRRTKQWYDTFEMQYCALSEVANMMRYLKSHGAGYHLAKSTEIWNAYTSEYYLMDSYYRKFRSAFRQFRDDSFGELREKFLTLANKVDAIYCHDYLDKLDENWINIAEDDFKSTGKIPGVIQQTDFYDRYVSRNDAKTYVIISDALRYEVAKSLVDELILDFKGQVELTSMQSIFPSITEFGMAALLPHKELTVKSKADRLEVLVDGVSSDSTNREKILQAFNPKSVALQAKKVLALKKSERIELVRDTKVVYIYHNKIDETGHQDGSDVFGSCQIAINEIKSLVRIIVNEFSGANILITADHGFVYTASELKEDDKLSIKELKNQDVGVGHRHVILKNEINPDYLIPVKFLNGASGFYAYAPRENIRLKSGGSNANFVHGGVSLQEMCVPLVQFHGLRNDSKEYKLNKSKYDTLPAELELVSTSRMLCNLIFNLEFYQNKAVGGNIASSKFKIFFIDSQGHNISGYQTVIADNQSSKQEERTYKVKFQLRQQKYDAAEVYQLVIKHSEGLVPDVVYDFHIDIAFSMDGFGF